MGGSSPNTVSYVVKWNGTGRTKLLDGAAGDPSYVLCFMLDDRTQEEWVYTCRLANHGSANPNPTIYRYPFSNGAVNKNRRETVYTATGNPIPIVVSGRGKYLGGNFPWPNAHRVIVATGQKSQLNQDDNWSCWAQICPDTSGRALHMLTDHSNILMYELSTPKGQGKRINMNKNMPGNRGKYDCPGLRWSNHPRFIASGFPLAIDQHPLGTPKFCIGRFTERFDSVEQWVTLPDTTTLFYNDQVGDVWLANGQGLTLSHVGYGHRGFAGTARIRTTWSTVGVTVSVQDGIIRDLAVLDPSGRTLGVQRRLDSPKASIPLHAGGVRILLIRTDSKRIKKTFTAAR